MLALESCACTAGCNLPHTNSHPTCVDQHFGMPGLAVEHVCDGLNLNSTLLSAVLLLARYGGEHAAPELQKEAVYGLTEIYRDQIKPARLVANPGCYPTTVQLPLYPLLKSKLILPEDIIIDSKSGACTTRQSVPQ